MNGSNTMTEKEKFESVYKDRLELLVSGYSYEKLGKISIPTVLLKYIERWYSYSYISENDNWMLFG